MAGRVASPLNRPAGFSRRFPRSPSFSPSLQSQSWVTALILGSLLGVIAYGTYDMTNLATLRGWPVALSAVDLV